MNKSYLLICFVLIGAFLLTSCNYDKLKSERLLDRLNSQIQTGNYKQIYEESSTRAKVYKYSEEEFIERMKTIVERMREVDESLMMKKHEGDYPYADESAFPTSRNAYRYVEKNGKRIGIDISIDSNLGTSTLVDFCIYTEQDGINENPPNDELCVSDASKS
jgi:hypothetical protein